MSTPNGESEENQRTSNEGEQKMKNTKIQI